MRTTFLHKNSIKYLLGILCMCILTHKTAFAGNDTYYAKLTVKPNATGAGKVYINEQGITEYGSSGDSEEIPFTVGAIPSEGYYFHEWTIITEGTATINDNTKITITASSKTESTPTSATATANFIRESINFGEPSGSWGNTIVTWKQPYLDGTITFPITNGYSDPKVIKIEDFSNGNTSLNNPQIGYSNSTVTISGTDPLYKLPTDGSRNVTFTLVATPDKGALTEGENTEKTYSATLNESLFNLTPIFTISSSKTVQTEPNKPLSFSIQPTDYGTLPINDVTWTASLSGESVFTLTSPNPIGGNCDLTYTPTAIGTHSATITLTATFTDAHTKVWTYTQTCPLNGNCFEDKDPEIQIQQGGVNLSSATYELITNESTTAVFDITSFGVDMESITASSSDGTIIQPTLSADKSSLTLSINSLSAPGTQDITITVSGTTTIGENVGSTISTTLIATIRRWFNTMTVTTNPDATSMILTWTNAGPEVTSYQIFRGSDFLDEVENTLTYTDEGLTADKSYTYTIKAIASGAEYSVHINTNTTSASSILKLSNCPEMFTITGVDASAAFDNKGKALMDRVYIMNKNNATRCHIYDKSDETTYTLTNTVNPQLEEGRAGRIIGKKIYIAGTCESLYWNAGDYLGWMQPVNCDIYLDNVRLSAAHSNEQFDVYKADVSVNETGGNHTDYSCVTKKASVFYLPEGNNNTNNTSTIHLCGTNYIGGNMAGKAAIHLNCIGSSSGATVLIPIHFIMSNFSAPIAIKDSILFTSDGTTNHPFDKNKVLSNTTKRPQIICQFDAVWADGAIKNDGYIDLSTRTSTLPDVTIGGTHMADRCIIDETGYSEAFGTKTNYTTKIWGHSYLPHLRYEAPLVTGGEHGTFIINGGQINLWPANGYTLDGYIQRTPLVLIPVLNRPSGNLIMRSGKSTNYMACGNSLWSIKIKGTDEEVFQESSDGILSFFDNANADCTMYGIGDGLPEGNLIINGGTISAKTDENSYGYTTGQPNVDNATVVNANDIKQPLFGPNVQINGGTFQWPLYGAKKNPHGTGKAFYGPEGESIFNREFICHNDNGDSNDHGKVRPPCGYDKPTTQKWNNGTLYNYTDFDVSGNPVAHKTKTYTIDWTWSILEWDESEYQSINQYAQSVSRAAYALPEANTDYTAFNEINTTTEPEAHNPLAEEGKKAVIGNAGTNKEYLYGMTNVWSDEKALGYFYLPEERSGIMQNYYIKSTDELTAFTQTKQGEVASTHFPYHLWIDKGGEISVANNYTIHGRPHYRATYTEDIYQTIAMPFTATKFFVTDPWDDQFRFYSYVEVDDANAAGVPEADRKAINNNAYCYLYFLDDEATNSAEDDDIVHDQRATGVNNTFRSYYHTHTDGSTMQAGKTYVIKFPKVDDTNYWGTNTVTLQGEKGQTILGKNGFTFATRPEATANDALNPSFIMDGNTTFATQDISGKGEVYLVDPAQWGNDSFHATTVSTLAPMQGYLVGSATTMQRYRIIGREGKVEQTALDQLIHTGWTAVGAHQAMLIMTPQDATAHIYTAEGKLWKTISLTANTGVVVNAPAGFYIVHTGNESKKVLVH